METNTNTTLQTVITPEELLAQWQGHRNLTRRVIEAFTEKDLFNFSIGGMRPFSEMVVELLAIAAPGIKEIVTGKTAAFNEDINHENKKAKLLELWDKTTEDINTYWAQIKPEQFHDTIKSFGEYEGTVWSSIFYFIDNEIHHRGQAYVYLRALNIEPPFFYER
ncbi:MULTISPECIES: DinB family protein [Flavobacteriaceae]|uniref:Damage-inducible protein DinB n=1 Tax=Meridianimaribacter flavus TaxID=571115 RepID=A0ABY2G590_9FLAO|nr:MULTISPECIES: DinB family protein [Flavobacteriaceae]TBV25220.1 damage-inducible protein DinB [Meridianimaribacter sp. CL38]TDY10637.1 putative damage-inducible protein DinB [Meridianimaribacter flavus]